MTVSVKNLLTCLSLLCASSVALPAASQTPAPAEGRSAEAAELAPTEEDGEEEAEVMEGPAPLPREATSENEERQPEGGDETDPLNGTGGNTDWVGSGGN